MASRIRRDHLFFLPAACPFHDGAEDVCQASACRLEVGEQRRRVFCQSENYDSCPFYLARLLRRMRPKYHASRCQEIGQK